MRPTIEEFSWHSAELVSRGETQHAELRYRVLRPDYKAPTLLVEVEIWELRESGPDSYYLDADYAVDVCIEDYVEKLERDGFVPSEESWPMTFELYSPTLERWLQYEVAAEFKPRFFVRRMERDTEDPT